jgi:hypothetical protein
MKRRSWWRSSFGRGLIGQVQCCLVALKYSLILAIHFAAWVWQRVAVCLPEYGDQFTPRWAHDRYSVGCLGHGTSQNLVNKLIWPEALEALQMEELCPSQVE